MLAAKMIVVLWKKTDQDVIVRDVAFVGADVDGKKNG